MNADITRRYPVTDIPISDQLDPLLDRVLRQRGIRCLDDIDTQTKALLHYRDLANIDYAAKLIVDAILQKKHICIIGDFDADGATSTALCMLCLRDFGHQTHSYIVPNRFDYGYGLSAPVVEIAAERKVDLIITVDNGIASFEGVEKAKSLGIEVIITDHHLPAETLPVANAIVNPNLQQCNFPSKNLAGVGVAFYLMLAVRACLTKANYFNHNQRQVPNIANYLDIVALGTVADVVALDKNNRILVHQGLQRIRSGKTRPGISALLSLAAKSSEKITSSDLGFVLGPRLNAAGRLEDMSTGIECLITESVESAYAFAHKLDQLNFERKKIEVEMQKMAEDTLNNINLDEDTMPNGICIFQEKFHVGVVGIVAGRLKDKYNRPSIVFARENESVIKGSARSISGLHIRDLLADIDRIQPGLIIKFGGHAAAAGLSINADDYQAFCQRFESLTEQYLQNLPRQAQLYSDGELSNSDMTLHKAHALKSSIPWGQAFDAPLFDGVFDLQEQRIVGQKHLKLVVSKNGEYFDAIAFNVDLQAWPNEKAKRVKIAYQLDANEFNQRTHLQLLIRCLQVAASKQ